jgi:Xaa-Pro aminopeptidase
MRLLAIFALCSVLASADGVTQVEYKARRDALRRALPGAVIELAGADESERGSLRSAFFQESNFYYFSGWTEPGARMRIGPETDTLYLPEKSEIRERYTGRKASSEDPGIREATGFDRVLSMNAWKEGRAEDAKVYGLKNARGLLEEGAADAGPAIARLRMVKSRREIELIQAATDASIAAHRAAWSRAEPGLFEYQVAAAMQAVYGEMGCERNAYPPIVASGPMSVILHYMSNRRRMDAGELLLMDVGAECSMYASDLTRTIPVSGRFTRRQRELYGIVLGAQKAAIAAAKPGMMLRGDRENSLERIAKEYMNKHGRDKHGQPLGKYFTHGLGHHVGLDVHDPADPELPLAEGMIVTIEPGLYVPEEATGIRIEDMILITKNGAMVMSRALPREPGEIEQAMRMTAR